MPLPAEQFGMPPCTKSPEWSLRAFRSWKCWSFKYISLMKERYKSQKTRHAEAAITAEAAPPALAIRPLMPFAGVHWSSPKTSLWWIDWEKAHSTSFFLSSTSAQQSHWSPVTQLIILEVNTGPQPRLAWATPPPTPQRKPPTGQTAGSGGKASPFHTEDSENYLPLTKILHQFFLNCNPCNSKLLELPHC